MSLILNHVSLISCCYLTVFVRLLNFETYPSGKQVSIIVVQFDTPSASVSTEQVSVIVVQFDTPSASVSTEQVSVIAF